MQALTTALDVELRRESRRNLPTAVGINLLCAAAGLVVGHFIHW
jgi:hypothetical protein